MEAEERAGSRRAETENQNGGQNGKGVGRVAIGACCVRGRGNATTGIASSRFAPAPPRLCWHLALSAPAPSPSSLSTLTASFSHIDRSPQLFPIFAWTPTPNSLRLVQEEVADAASEVEDGDGRADEVVDVAQLPSAVKTARATPNTSRRPGSRRSSTRTMSLRFKRSKLMPP